MNEFLSQLRGIAEYQFLKVGENQFTLLSVTKLLLMVCLVVAIERLLRRYFVMNILKRTRLEPNLQFSIGKISGYTFVLLGLYVVLQNSGVNLSSVTVLAGTVGLGIGFGLQHIIHNCISGLVLLAERPITLGDRIEVAGVAGQVRKISLRSTTVITNDNIAIIVPNSDFITHPITNWSHGDPRVRFRIRVSVAHGTDVEKLQRILVEVAMAHPSALREPRSEVFFDSFGESALNFELVVWSQDMTFKPRRFRSDLNYAIERKLRENGIRVPFPQRDLHLHWDDAGSTDHAITRNGAPLDLDAPQEDKDEQNDHQQTQPPARVVTPIPAVGPSGKRADQHQNEQNQQNGS